MSSFRPFLLITPLLATLSACGAETVGTAAVVATQKQQEVEAGQQMKASVQQQLYAAQALEQERLEAATKP